MSDKQRTIVLSWPDWPDHANTFLAIRERLLSTKDTNKWAYGDDVIMKRLLNEATVNEGRSND